MSSRPKTACWSGGWAELAQNAGWASAACPPFSATIAEGWWARRGAPLPTLQSTSREARLPLHVLLFRGRRGLVAGADDPDLIAIGDAIGRRGDDAIVGSEAGGQFDFPAEVAGDGHRLEQHLVVGTDGGDAKAILVEDERAGGNVQRYRVALQRQADVGIAARHQFAVRIVERELHARGA